MSETQGITHKKKHGGFRKGAGRKPLPVSENARLAIKEAIVKNPRAFTEIWEKCIEKAKKGSIKHAALVFAYQYGKPVESVNITAKAMTINKIIVSMELPPSDKSRTNGD